jgi:hypothetical protein
MPRGVGIRGRSDRDKKIPDDAIPHDKLVESTKKLLWGGNKAFEFPVNRQGWAKFTLDHFPIPLPKQKVCEDHDTPLDFFIQFVTGKFEHLINIILCSRGSFKTYTIADGCAIKMMYQPGCKILYMAGIKDQTDQGHEYFREFWNGFAYTSNYMNPQKDIQAGYSYLNNGSLIHFGAFTEAMANSKRYPVVIVDEVDSVEPYLRRSLTEDLISVPDRIFGIQPTIIFTSSLREFGGTMSWLLEKNGKIQEWLERGICKLWMWCYKETTEKCRRYVGRCEKYFEKEQYLRELEEIGELKSEKQGSDHRKLKQWVYHMERDCPLVVSCHGDLHRAPEPAKPGALRDLWGKGGLIDKVKALSKKAIRAQYDCVLPKERGKLYDEELILKRVVPGLQYVGDPRYENHLLVDWGFSQATAVILIQRDLSTSLDHAVKCWKWVRRNPNWRIDQVEQIWKEHAFPQVHTDAENADMNNLVEQRGIEVDKVAFGGPSAIRDKSKLAYAIGILEKRLELGLILFSEEECDGLITCLRSLLDKPKGGKRFGIEDDHFHSSLLTLYANETLEMAQILVPQTSENEPPKSSPSSHSEPKPILVTNPKVTDSFDGGENLF